MPGVPGMSVAVVHQDQVVYLNLASRWWHRSGLRGSDAQVSPTAGEKEARAPQRRDCWQGSSRKGGSLSRHRTRERRLSRFVYLGRKSGKGAISLVTPGEGLCTG